MAGYLRRVHRDFEPGPYVESLAKLCVVHNLANFPIFPRWWLFQMRSYFAGSAQSSVAVY